MRYIFPMLLIVAVSQQVTAQKFEVGNSLGVDIPFQEFVNELNLGLAFNMNLEYSWKTVSATGEIGWVRWLANANFQSDTPPDAWALLAGLRLRAGKVLFLGTKAGYYFNYPGKVVLIPEIGGRYKRYELNMGYSLLRNSEFLRIRFTYFWGD